MDAGYARVYSVHGHALGYAMDYAISPEPFHIGRQKVEIILDIRPSTQMNTSNIQMNYERFFVFFALSLSSSLQML